jgi:uncharacterized membrane protein
MSSFLAFAPVGAILMALGVVLQQGRVGPNAWYGGRRPRSLRGREAWRTATRAAGSAMIAGGAGVVVASVAGAALGATLEDEVPTLLVLGLLVASVAVGVLRALAVLRR